ncbi:MAG: ABC transporter permease [Cytophagales bacterium]|nr:ABC transporter permease [Cytophagales bacterium]
MIRHYIKLSLRNLLKDKVHAAINIFGLCIGVTAFALIFLFIRDDLKYDRYNVNFDRIYRIGLHGKMGDTEFTQTYTTPMFSRALLESCPEIEAATRMDKFSTFVALEENGVVEKKFEEKNFFSADPAVFDIFTFETLAGKPKDALTKPNTLVLTLSSAERYFGTDIPLNEILGKILLVEWGGADLPHRIEAVIEDMPDQSHFHFDFLNSTENLSYKDQDNWWNNFFKTYILLYEGKDISDVEAAFYEIHKKHMGGEKFDAYLAEGNIWESFTQPLADIHLKSNIAGEFEANGNYQYLVIFSLAAIFLIIIACVNFVNLSTARATAKARETGVRKVVGSLREQLIFQYLTESFISCILAVNFALILTTLLLPAFNSFAGKQLEIGYFSNWHTIPAILAFTFFIGLLAGLYPAFYLTSFQPSKILKGNQIGNRSNRGFRNILVVFQFSISIILIISTFVVYHQLNYLQNKSLGFKKDNILVVRNIENLGNKLGAFRNELMQNPSVRNTSSSSHIIGQNYNNVQFRPEGYESNIVLDLIGTDHDYDDVYGFEMLSGRYFSHEYPTDSFGIIINEEAALSLGWQDPLGKEIKYGGYTGLPLTVIGVVKNFHYVAKHERIRPMVILPSFNKRMYRQYLSLKIDNSDVKKTISEVKNTWNKLAGDIPFEYFFFDQAYDDLYRNEQHTMSVFIVFSILTVFIAVLGLIGLVIYSSEQRTKEIGVRKSMGASVYQIVLMLSKDYLKWVLVGFVISVPAAYLIIERWLGNFAYQTRIRPWFFAAGGVIALVISCFFIGFQAFKAAGKNPVDALRDE